MKNQAISIIVPTLNEVENVSNLLSRIDASMKHADIMYEVIIVDDHSKDNTAGVAGALAAQYPVKVLTKRGKRGKAYSLLEGFAAADHNLVAMLDADLQYPPEEIVPMLQLMQTSNADLIVTNRIQDKVSPLRQLSTKIFNLMFARILFGISFDTQSGLKLFKKNILTHFTMKPSPWSFDLEFIVRTIEHKYKVASHDIPFEERVYGETKVNLVKTTFELAKASLELKWRTSNSRLRAGMRANNRFLKRAFPATLLAVTLGMAAAVPSVGAVSLPAESVALAVPSTPVGSVRDTLTPANSPSQTPTSPNMQPSTSPEPTANSTKPSSPTENSVPTPSTNGALTVSSGGGSSSNLNNFNDVNNDGTLAAATDTNKQTDIYKSGYPYYTLGAGLTERFNDGARIAIIVAVIFAGIAILVTGARSISNLGGRLVTRS